LEVARAELGIAESVLMPSLDAFLSTNLGAVSLGGGDVSTDANVGLSGLFDPDIAGGNKARRDAARASLNAASLNVEDIQRLGLSPALDVDRAAADLARSTGQRGLFEAARKNAAYSLSVLSGEPPRSLLFEQDRAAAIPSFSGKVNLGVPTDLLRQRPDIRQAEAELLAASELIGAENPCHFQRLLIFLFSISAAGN